MEQRDAGGEEALGRGDAGLRAGGKRQGDIDQCRERRFHIVDQADRERAATLGGLGELQRVRAAAGLRGCDEDGAREIELLAIDRGEAGAERGDGQAERALQQVFAIGHGVIGGAARAGRDEGRLAPPELFAQLRHGVGIGRNLARSDLGRLGRLAGEKGFRHRSGHRCAAGSGSWHRHRHGRAASRLRQPNALTACRRRCPPPRPVRGRPRRARQRGNRH